MISKEMEAMVLAVRKNASYCAPECLSRSEILLMEAIARLEAGAALGRLVCEAWSNPQIRSLQKKRDTDEVMIGIRYDEKNYKLAHKSDTLEASIEAALKSFEEKSDVDAADMAALTDALGHYDREE